MLLRYNEEFLKIEKERAKYRREVGRWKSV